MRVKKNNKNDRDTFVSTKETKMPLYIVKVSDNVGIKGLSKNKY